MSRSSFHGSIKDNLDPIQPEFDAFNEGVTRGGLRSKNDVMLLICYVLKSVQRTVPAHIVTNALQEEELANYFTIMEAISDLIENGNLKKSRENGEDMLTLTEQGLRAVSVIEQDLPLSIRETAVKATVHANTLERNMRDNKVEIKEEEDGCKVTFTLNAEETELLKLTVFVTDYDHAVRLRTHFLEDPVKVYSALLTALVVD